MDDIAFQSTLSMDEIEANFRDVDFFEGLMSGLEEALAYEKGSAKAETLARKASLPEIDVAAERRAMNLTQRAFAKVLGVSVRTVEAWESGRSNPSPTARKLLYLLSNDHSLLLKLQ